MKIGLFGINVGSCGAPEVAGRVAVAAEEAGFESVWTGEHIVLPDPQTPPSPAPPELPMLDPPVSLAFIAARTKRLRLGTGIIILPQRNPLVLAKALASVDVLSGGRLIFGVGVGYLKAEFDALGVSFDARGARTDEYLDAITEIWTSEKPVFRGRYVSFEGVRAEPRPVQSPHPPIVIGGHSKAALRRANRRGAGWYGFALDPEATGRCMEGLREARRRDGRSEELGELEITVTPPRPLDPELARRYADLGVDRLVTLPGARGPDELVDWVTKAAEVVTALA
ncbi:MAG: LLM class F420-dependent oxidoreductase [Myxococcota bacterium]